jgi:hypothetical protein
MASTISTVGTTHDCELTSGNRRTSKVSSWEVYICMQGRKFDVADVEGSALSIKIIPIPVIHYSIPDGSDPVHIRSQCHIRKRV